MNSIVISIVILVLASQSLALKFTDCGSKTGRVTNVQVSGCEDTDVCDLQRGSKYNLAVAFDALSDSESLKAVVHGIVGGVQMPFPFPNADACEHGGVDCPVENGKSYNYAHEIEIQKNYPSLRADVKWELRDEHNENMACVLFPVRIA